MINLGEVQNVSQYGQQRIATVQNGLCQLSADSTVSHETGDQHSWAIGMFNWVLQFWLKRILQEGLPGKSWWDSLPTSAQD